MIEPLVKESDWLTVLRGLPEWLPPGREILIVAPHPDDETLGAGGLIAACCRRGIPVTVAAVTDGERAYPDTPGLAELRRDEQNQALAILGVKANHIIRIGLPDSGLTDCRQTLMDHLTRIISAQMHVIAPWRGDFHPDHQVCGLAAEKATRSAGATLTSYFFWTWHMGTPSLLETLKLSRFVLNSDLLNTKSRALSCHRSQLYRDHGNPILPPALLFPAKRPFEVFASS